jgi:hypothetical protein
MAVLRALVALLLLGACGGSDGGGRGGGAGADAAGGGSDAQPGEVDGAPARPWTTLMSFDWSYGPTREDWSCETIAVEEDTYFSAFRLTGAMPGTFRAILSVEDEPAQTGEYLCPLAGAVPGERFLFAAGWGEDDHVVMPEGTAMKVEAGKYLTLWVHIVNESAAMLDGDSGVEVQTIPAAEVVHQAGMFMLGTWTIDVPSDGDPHQASRSAEVRC